MMALLTGVAKIHTDTSLQAPIVNEALRKELSNNCRKAEEYCSSLI